MTGISIGKDEMVGSAKYIYREEQRIRDRRDEKYNCGMMKDCIEVDDANNKVRGMWTPLGNNYNYFLPTKSKTRSSLDGFVQGGGWRDDSFLPSLRLCIVETENWNKKTKTRLWIAVIVK